MKRILLIFALALSPNAWVAIENDEADLLVVCGKTISDIHINFDFKNNLVTERVFYKPFYLEALRATSSGD